MSFKATTVRVGGRGRDIHARKYPLPLGSVVPSHAGAKRCFSARDCRRDVVPEPSMAFTCPLAGSLFYVMEGGEVRCWVLNVTYL